MKKAFMNLYNLVRSLLGTYKEIDKTKIPSQNLFYKDDFSIRIKKAELEDIKEYETGFIKEDLSVIIEKVKAIVCMGLDHSKIHAAFDGVVEKIIDTSSAEEAVKKAYAISQKGDVVLLSPACASFDLFKNYEDRGQQFKKAVKEL